MSKRVFELTKQEEVINMISKEIRMRLNAYEGDLDQKVVLAAYLLAKVKRAGYITGERVSYSEIIEGKFDICDEILKEIKHKISSDEWQKLSDFLGAANSSEFASTAVYYSITPSIRSDADQTPSSIVKLAASLLDIKSTDTVVDLCSGIGSFISETGQAIPEADYAGYELNKSKKVIAMIRAELLDLKVDYHTKSVFDLPDSVSEAFDKVFSNFPLHLRPREVEYIQKYIDDRSVNLPSMAKLMTADWAFADVACRVMKRSGKAMVLMPSGSLSNNSEADIRKDFLERGLIETVILLPEKLFGYTMMNAALFVLSHGNQSVRIVDASSICHHGKRRNEFSEADIKQIVKGVVSDTPYSRTVDLAELRENRYSLGISKYIDSFGVADGVKLADLIVNISRGTNLNASSLDALSSPEKTMYKYLSLGDVQDGIINANLSSLTSIEPRLERHCAQNGSLLISKNGKPFKVAVVEVPAGEQILVSGNFHIVELDKSKVDPYFVLAYLNSEQGSKMMNQLAVGNTLPVLSKEQVLEIKIPALSQEAQQKIAFECRSRIDEVAMMKKKLEMSLYHLHNVYRDR